MHQDFFPPGIAVLATTATAIDLGDLDLREVLPSKAERLKDIDVGVAARLAGIARRGSKVFKIEMRDKEVRIGAVEHHHADLRVLHQKAGELVQFFHHLGAHQVDGRIFDGNFKDGTSVVGAKVDIERINSDGSVKKLGSGETNISGEFTYRQTEGSAKLRVTVHYNKSSGSKEIEVSEPAIYRLAISLDINRDGKP